MKLVVGLGNPGRRYARTRHNVGFRIVERFAETRGLAIDEQRFEGRFGSGQLCLQGSLLEVALLQPETFMNQSGLSVAAALRELPVAEPAADLLVVFDDVDLPFGRLRLRPGGSAGGHRGLEDVLVALCRSDLPRLRFGVGRPADGRATRDWVLQPFSPEEERRLPGHIDEACDAIAAALSGGVASAMGRFNRAPPEAS